MLPFGGIGRRRSVRGFSCVRLSCRPWSLRRSCRSSRSETPRLRFGSSRFAGRVQRWSGLSSCSGGKIRQGTGRVKLGDGSPIHGTEGFACLVAGLTRLAASPMISRSEGLPGRAFDRGRGRPGPCPKRTGRLRSRHRAQARQCTLPSDLNLSSSSLFTG